MGRQVWVKPHYRKDGTWVDGHFRTAPDKSCYNNFGYPGNPNPNTMEITKGDPLAYLETCRSGKSKLPRLKRVKTVKSLKTLRTRRW